MLTAFLKLFDIAARSLFVLVVLYNLADEVSGQFGLILTLMGLYAFICGYERYVDIQRNIVARSSDEANVLFISAIRFYVLNYLLWCPVLLFLLVRWVDITLYVALLALVISVGEHLSNEFYRMSVVSNQNKSIVLISMLKNLLLLFLAGVGILYFPEYWHLENIVLVWAALSALTLIISFLLYIARMGRHVFIQRLFGSGLHLKKQLKDSFTHFRLGLLAVLAIQMDRLIAGGFLTLAESGVYFRHLFLAMSAYQVMNVASYNKILGRVYQKLKNRELTEARHLILKERIIYSGFTVLGVLGVLLFEYLDLFNYFQIEGVVPLYLVLVLLAYLVRGLADFNCMILNGIFQEQKVLWSHGITAATAGIASAVLAGLMGLPGLLSALIVTGVTYYLVSRFYAERALLSAGFTDKQMTERKEDGTC